MKELNTLFLFSEVESLASKSPYMLQVHIKLMMLFFHYLKVTKYSNTLNLAILVLWGLSLNVVHAKPVKCMAYSLYQLPISSSIILLRIFSASLNSVTLLKYVGSLFPFIRSDIQNITCLAINFDNILCKQTVPTSLVGTIKLASMNNATEVSTIVVAKLNAHMNSDIEIRN